MPRDLDLWDDAIKEAIALSDPGITYYGTLEVRHASFLEPLRVVASDAPLPTPQGTYLPAAIGVSVPDTQAAGRGEAVITLDFLPAAAQNAILSASLTRDPVTILYRQYLAPNENPKITQKVPMEVFAVVMTSTGIEARAMFADLVNAPALRALYTTTRFPGIQVA